MEVWYHSGGVVHAGARLHHLLGAHPRQAAPERCRRWRQTSPRRGRGCVGKPLSLSDVDSVLQSLVFDAKLEITGRCDLSGGGEGKEYKYLQFDGASLLPIKARRPPEIRRECRISRSHTHTARKAAPDARTHARTHRLPVYLTRVSPYLRLT